MTNNSFILKTRLRAEGAIDERWAAKLRSLFAVTGAPAARRSRLRPSSLVDHVRFFPVRSSGISQQKRLLAVYLKTRTC